MQHRFGRSLPAASKPVIDIGPLLDCKEVALVIDDRVQPRSGEELAEDAAAASQSTVSKQKRSISESAAPVTISRPLTRGGYLPFA